MNHQVSLEDRKFLAAFEAGQVPPKDFGHCAHLRLAYTYLVDMPTNEAFSSFRKAIQKFLCKMNIGPEKYHDTLTGAWILAVRHFMEHSVSCESAEAFFRANPLALDTRIMLTHYSTDRLFSDDARAEFIEPDLDPIPIYADANS